MGGHNNRPEQHTCPAYGIKFVTTEQQECTYYLVHRGSKQQTNNGKAAFPGTASE